MYDGKISAESLVEITSLCDDLICAHEAAIVTMAEFVNSEYGENSRKQIVYRKHAISALRELKSQANQRQRKAV